MMVHSRSIGQRSRTPVKTKASGDSKLEACALSDDMFRVQERAFIGGARLGGFGFHIGLEGVSGAVA